MTSFCPIADVGRAPPFTARRAATRGIRQALSALRPVDASYGAGSLTVGEARSRRGQPDALPGGPGIDFVVRRDDAYGDVHIVLVCEPCRCLRSFEAGPEGQVRVGDR